MKATVVVGAARGALFTACSAQTRFTYSSGQVVSPPTRAGEPKTTAR
jgi:hypothetical protein